MKSSLSERGERQSQVTEVCEDAMVKIIDDPSDGTPVQPSAFGGRYKGQRVRTYAISEVGPALKGGKEIGSNVES